MTAQDCKINMTVDNLSMDKAKLFAEQVDLKFWSKVLISSRKSYLHENIPPIFIMTSFHLFALQVLLLDKETRPKNFEKLNPIDRDLIMCTITNLSLVEEIKTSLVCMNFKLKRKVSNELLTTYLPTSLLLLISFVSIFFERKLLG